MHLDSGVSVEDAFRAAPIAMGKLAIRAFLAWRNRQTHSHGECLLTFPSGGIWVRRRVSPCRQGPALLS